MSDQPPEPPDASAEDVSSELEPGELVRSELGRLGHHPREEARRLHAEAEEGEVGATPYIEVSRVAVVVIAVFLVMIAIALIAYYVIR